MTYTLLLRLAGPMQSWGLQSRFSIRDSAREPTKSGVLGLICAAMGRPRDASLDDLRALRMCVRVDREGQARRDFHTAQHVLIASSSARQLERGKPKLKNTEPSVRHYLADAHFTVALVSENESLLRRIDDALAAPKWPLFFGRKAFVPGLPVRIVGADKNPMGVQSGAVVDLLLGFTDPIVPVRTHAAPPRRLVLDADIPHDQLRVVQKRMQPDDPVSFQHRRFLPRHVVVGYEQDVYPSA